MAFFQGDKMKFIERFYDKKTGKTLKYTPQERLATILDDWSKRDKAKNLKAQKKYLEGFNLMAKDFDNQIVVDIGCGPWGGVLNFAKNAQKTIAIDPLIKHYILIGIADFKSKFLIEGGEEISLPSNYVDMAFCLNALDHCDNTATPKKIVEEIYRILKPEGKAYIFVHLREEKLNILHLYALEESDLKDYFKDFYTILWEIKDRDNICNRDFKTFWGIFSKK